MIDGFFTDFRGAVEDIVEMLCQSFQIFFLSVISEVPSASRSGDELDVVGPYISLKPA